MCVDGKVARVFAAELGFSRPVLQEIACHPVIFIGACQVLHCFAPVAPMQFGAALTGRAYEHNGKPGIEAIVTRAALP